MTRVQVVGIVNRTPDSFHDGGATFALEAAAAAAVDAQRAGADWVDIGGCPIGRAHEVSPAEETERVVPVVAELTRVADLAVPIMVDTFRAAVARAAMEAGAQGINDTSGLYDPRMATVAAETGALLVLTHSRSWPDRKLSRPPYRDVVREVRAGLLDLVRRALAAGVRAERIVLDPGHDLWKSPAESLELTARLDAIVGLGFPVMVAVSYKPHVTETTGQTTGAGTVAANTAAVLRGARWIRVHDVPAGVAVARMGEAILAAGRDPPGRLAVILPRHVVDGA